MWTAAPGRGDLEALGDRLPADGLEAPDAVADDQPQPLAAVSPLAQLALADAEHALDGLAVGELAHPGALRRRRRSAVRDAEAPAMAGCSVN